MQFSYPINQKKAPIKTMTSFVLPCPLEDHDMFVQTKLDDGNIAMIGRVLEIEAHELVFLLLKPFLEHGKKTLDFGTVVRVSSLGM